MSATVATIGRTSAAVPENVYSQEEIKSALRGLLSLEADRTRAVMVLFDAAGVERRHSVLPIEAIGRPRPLAETMAIYRHHAVKLGRQGRPTVWPAPASAPTRST
jgi:predicted naringenin-chalcone synthase